MPSFADNIFLVLLALVLLGPKNLPKLAREIGKWIGEFRRASNEFKMQMDEEMRLIEREERDKKAAAIEAAAPRSPDLPQPADTIPEPEHPHMPSTANSILPVASEPEIVSGPSPEPIASAGDLHLMPPATGLPTPRSPRSGSSSDAFGGLIDSIPARSDAAAADGGIPAETTESTHHG